MAEENAEVESAAPMFVDVGEQIQGTSSDSQVTSTADIKTEKATTVVSRLEPRPRLKCTECLRFTTDDEDKMLRHIRKVHRGENPFQCTMCEYSTYNKAVFEEHIRVHQGIKPFKCSFCPYKSASKKNTKKHELIHRPNNPLRCPDCPFIARHYRGLCKHQQTHITDPTLLKCRSCFITFKNGELYENHRKPCGPCKKKICSYIYEKHMAKHGAKCRPRIKKKHTFTCDICGWEGSSKSRILLHLIHHPRQNPPAGVDISVLSACGIHVGML